eukprot:3082826-Ditylum_brightwellii.AAC.1
MDPTILVAIETIVTVQSHGTKAITKAVAHLLDYCTTHLDAVICYRTLGMILKVHSNTSYLSEKEAHSRAGGYFFMGDKNNNQFIA